MNKKTNLLLLVILLISSSIFGKNRPTNLMTDLLEHTEVVYKHGFPTNISLSELDANNDYQFAEIRSSKPTFGWIVPRNEGKADQKSYRIILANSKQSAQDERNIIWDSQLINSNNSVSVPYKGIVLLPNTTYFWKVKIVTNNGESEWSDIKSFRTSNKLAEYAESYYPLIKSVEYAKNIKSINSQNVFVDFGKAAFGTLRVTLTSEEESNKIKIHLGEHQIDNRVDREPSGTIRYQAYPLSLRKGTHTYQIQIRNDKRNTGSAAILMPDYIGEVIPFRYCEIEGYERQISGNDIIRESVHYPFDESASFFESSDEVLNQIWDLCKYSIKATSFLGIYVDGDRERIPYEADALINQLCHYGVDKEYSMARRSHEHLLKYPTWPTEWIIQSVLIAWHDYMYTGDERSLKANYELLKKRTLHNLKDKNGLISTKTGLLTKEVAESVNFHGEIRDIVDWPHTGILGLNKHEGGEADGFVFTDYNAVVNAYYYEAIKVMGKIANVLHLPDEAKQYDVESKSFKDLFLKSFFDQSKGYFIDGLAANTDHASLHSNMFPIAFGMVPDKNIKSVLDFMKTRGMACSVYGSQFLMDAIYEANDAEYGLEMLTKTDDRSWYNMIRVGSTISLEAWDNKYKPNQDWNHAWGAAPANIIPRKLLGLEPITPSFGIARLKPQLAHLSWVKSKIPTIRGVVGLDINNEKGKYEMKVSIPSNMEVEVFLPLLANKYKVTCNDKEVSAKKIKDEPFISLGKIPSGNYIFTMSY